MRFKETTVENKLVATVLDSRIVADSALQLKQQIIHYVNEGHKAIVLDFSNVTFIDSSGLGALISGLKAVGQNGQLVISATRAAVMSSFKLTRMDRVFRMYASTDDAIAALP